MTIGIIGMLLAIVVMIAGAYRGIKVIPLTFLAATVVILTNRMGIWQAYSEFYAGGFGGTISRFFFIFVSSAIYAAIMEKTGCASSIGNQMVKWFGTKHVMAVVYFFTVILTFGGVNLFVVFFAALPIAYVMFKEANLPRALIIGPMGAGGAGITMTTLPGTPSLTNIIPSQHLGTPLTAAPLFSLILAVLIVALSLMYFRIAEASVRRKGEQFTFPVNFDTSNMNIDKSLLPHPVKAFVPIIFLPLFIIGSSVLNMVSGINVPYAADPIQLTTVAMLIGSILCLLLNLKKAAGGAVKNWITDGATNGLTAIMGLAAVLAFGAVVSSADAFQLILRWVMDIELSVYLKALVSTGIISGIVGSSSGGAVITLGALAPHFIEVAQAGGANLEVLHRLIAMSAGTLDTLPHVSAIFVFLSVLGCTHKEAYKYLFWPTVVIPTIVTIIGVIAATIIW